MTDYERRLMKFRNRKKKKEAPANEGPSKAGAAERPQAQAQLAGKAENEITFNDLRQAAKEAGIEGYGKMTKPQLTEALKQVGKL